MAQWGEIKKIDGVKVVPLIKTDTWIKASPSDTISAVLMLDSEITNPWPSLEIAKGYVGKPYGTWLKAENKN